MTKKKTPLPSEVLLSRKGEYEGGCLRRVWLWTREKESGRNEKVKEHGGRGSWQTLSVCFHNTRTDRKLSPRNYRGGHRDFPLAISRLGFVLAGRSQCNLSYHHKTLENANHQLAGGSSSDEHRQNRTQNAKKKLFVGLLFFAYCYCNRPKPYFLQDLTFELKSGKVQHSVLRGKMGLAKRFSNKKLIPMVEKKKTRRPIVGRPPTDTTQKIQIHLVFFFLVRGVNMTVSCIQRSTDLTAPSGLHTHMLLSQQKRESSQCYLEQTDKLARRVCVFFDRRITGHMHQMTGSPCQCLYHNQLCDHHVGVVCCMLSSSQFFFSLFHFPVRHFSWIYSPALRCGRIRNELHIKHHPPFSLHRRLWGMTERKDKMCFRFSERAAKYEGQRLNTSYVLVEAYRIDYNKSILQQGGGEEGKGHMEMSLMGFMDYTKKVSEITGWFEADEKYIILGSLTDLFFENSEYHFLIIYSINYLSNSYRGTFYHIIVFLHRYSDFHPFTGNQSLAVVHLSAGATYAEKGRVDYIMAGLTFRRFYPQLSRLTMCTGLLGFSQNNSDFNHLFRYILPLSISVGFLGNKASAGLTPSKLNHYLFYIICEGLYIYPYVFAPIPYKIERILKVPQCLFCPFFRLIPRNKFKKEAYTLFNFPNK
ncbi:hypothetical protein VP01_1948g1 [Puccinia sorghi]|uniref:Uncharacterized protein n=1 Tax=Puccinia sorghi TaxID=27349 RepID=A0A0L6VC92_9BASI|nr:hypothetical protein VP01_1948g1 [Puccinia sorghi]